MRAYLFLILNPFHNRQKEGSLSISSLIMSQHLIGLFERETFQCFNAMKQLYNCFHCKKSQVVLLYIQKQNMKQNINLVKFLYYNSLYYYNIFNFRFKKKNKKNSGAIFFREREFFFLGAISLGNLMVPSSKIVIINLPRTYENLPCKGEPYRFIG